MPAISLEVMLRTHFLQQWFNLLDPAMEEAFFDIPLYRESVGLNDNSRLPDESTPCALDICWKNTACLPRCLQR